MTWIRRHSKLCLGLAVAMVLGTTVVSALMNDHDPYASTCRMALGHSTLGKGSKNSNLEPMIKECSHDADRLDSTGRFDQDQIREKIRRAGGFLS